MVIIVKLIINICSEIILRASLRVYIPYRASCNPRNIVGSYRRTEDLIEVSYGQACHRLSLRYLLGD